MPGTNFPDSLVIYNQAPPPREVFTALLDSGFTFLGAGPMDKDDVWFVKKVTLIPLKQENLNIIKWYLIKKKNHSKTVQ